MSFISSNMLTNHCTPKLFRDTTKDTTLSFQLKINAVFFVETLDRCALSSVDGSGTLHRPQPLPPSTVHQGGLSNTDGSSTYGAASNRHGFTSYSDSFISSTASSNHVGHVSNGLCSQVGRSMWRFGTFGEEAATSGGYTCWRTLAVSFSLPLLGLQVNYSGTTFYFVA